MQVSPYLNFKGNCEEAFKFYEKNLGARVGDIFRFAGSPAAEQAPPGWGEKVMHGSVTVGNVVLMGSDTPPDRYEPAKGFSLSLQFQNVAEAERAFGELANGGTVVMPLEQTFWAARFGMLVDRFGVPWQVNCEFPAQS